MSKRDTPKRNVTDFTFGVRDYDRYWETRKLTADTGETGIHRRISKLVRQYVPSGRPVLDCGVGPAIYFQDLAGDYEMHGVEFSAEAISLYQFNTSRIVQFDLNKGLPTLSMRFDGLVASMILHHLDDPRIFLRGARAAMADGGILLIVHPNLVYFQHRLKLLVGQIPKWSTSHRNFIVPARLHQMIEEAGFTVQAVTSKKRKWLPLLFAHELFYICEAR